MGEDLREVFGRKDFEFFVGQCGGTRACGGKNDAPKSVSV
jgi:hypothetical protein